MPDNQPQPPKRAWKDVASSSGSPSKSGPAWKGTTSTSPTTRQPWSKKSKLVLGAALLGLFAGLFVVIALLLRGLKPVRLVVLTAGYETNLAIPHNVPGRMTADNLYKWANDLDAHRKVKIEPRKANLTLDLSTLDDTLKDWDAKVLVLFIAAHGAADEEGAYLIPQDADPRDPKKSRIYITQILERLSQMPSGSKKLLILDATQVASHWPLGLFHNNFARKLKELEPKIKEIEGLVVLSASQEDERSWVAEEWRQSIFGHHIHEGLRGAVNPGNRRITAHALFEYTRDKVKNWARQNRGSRQTPVLLGGVERAKGMELVAVERTYKPPEVKPFEKLDRLMEAWSDAQNLMAPGKLSPAVYTPHLWRQYLETLLRYEDLVRAEDTNYADRVFGELSGLHKRIVEARVRKLRAAGGTLTMPAALGGFAAPGAATEQAEELRDLWDKGDELIGVKDKLGQWLGGAKDSWERRLLRVRLSGLLVRQATTNPEKYLKLVAKLLKEPAETSDPRTAEAHYLVMLDRDRDRVKKLPWDTIKDALEVRQLAEEAALGQQAGEVASGTLPPCSEQLLPWIRELIDKGDNARRVGQDDLLASAEKHWKSASQLLTEARTHYQKAQAVALKVREALKQRDEALATLPYHSQWLARQRFFEPGDLAKHAEEVRKQAQLWDRVQQLDKLLRTPNPESLAVLSKLTVEIRTGMDKVRKEFADRYRVPYRITQENWHQIDNLLRIPFIPAKERIDLLLQLRKISDKLNSEAEGAGGKEVSESQQRNLERENARWNGQLALATFGEDAFRSQKGAIDYEEVKNDVVAAPDRTRAGDEIALRWNRTPQFLTDKLVQARTQRVEKVADHVRDLASWARRLPGAAVGWLGRIDPLEEQRQLQLYDLLCWQADRTSNDFLASEDDGLPYYRAAGMVYASDARTQLADQEGVTPKQQALRLERVNQVKALLDDDGRIPVVAVSDNGRKFVSVTKARPVLIQLTDEPKQDLWYYVQAPPTVPQGHPVLWRDLNDKQAFLKKPETNVRILLPRLGGEATKEGSVYYPLIPKERDRDKLPGGNENADQIVRGLYRGHRLIGDTPILHYVRPEIGASLPWLSEVGKLAIQADDALYRKYGEGTGTVVLVLDCSGSMKKNRLMDGSGRTRFDAARDALTQVLAQIPPRTKVSVWVFSHRVDVDNPNRHFDLGDGTDPEKYVQRLWPARNSDKKSSPRPKRWDKDMFEEVKERLRILDCYNETPIVRAMMDACQDFKDEKGRKTLVVLTDGMDNRFRRIDAQGKPVGDNVYNPNGAWTIPDFLVNTFGKTDIAIRIVGFQLPTRNANDENEQEIAKRQFEEPLKKLKEKGKFYLVDDTAKLIEKLRESLPQRLFFSLEGTDRQPVEIKGLGTEIEVSRMGNNSRWVSLRSGTYYVNIRAHKGSPQRIMIHSGYRLRLNLSENGKDFVLEPDRVAKSFPGRVLRQAEAHDWLFSVLQNQKVLEDPNWLQLTVTAEYLRARKFLGEGTLGHIKPRLVFFQVRPKNSKTPELPSMSYHALGDYTGPAWGLNVHPWQPDQKPILEAFWAAEDPLQEITNPLVLKRDEHFAATKELKVLPPGDSFNMQLTKRTSGEVRLLSLKIEKHWVEVYDAERGKMDKREVSCLVVRLQFPQGHPVMARLGPPGSQERRGGQEHRFYAKAGRYTGIFWEWTREDVERDLEAISLISLTNFRENAQASGRYVRIELGVPDAADRRPEPPQ